MSMLSARSLLAAAALTLASATQAAIINGGFETGDLTGWSSQGSAVVSSGKNYGAPGTVNPFQGSNATLINTNSNISAAALAAQMGTTEAALEATNGNLNATQGSIIWTSSTAAAGDSFSFRWNFVEQDYLPYDDWAFYGISIDGGPATLTKFASLATVGPSGGSTINGWETLTVNITQAGNYTFFFGIVDALDFALASELWIDGVSGTGVVGGNTVPVPGALGLSALALAGFAALRRRKA